MMKNAGHASYEKNCTEKNSTYLFLLERNSQKIMY